MKRSVPQLPTVTVSPPVVNVDMANIADAIKSLVITQNDSRPPRKLEVVVTERDVRGGIKRLEINEL